MPTVRKISKTKTYCFSFRAYPEFGKKLGIAKALTNLDKNWVEMVWIKIANFRQAQCNRMPRKRSQIQIK